MERFGKRYSMEQLLYRSITFADGINDKHNAAVRVKLVSALMESEVGRVSSQYTYKFKLVSFIDIYSIRIQPGYAECFDKTFYTILGCVAGLVIVIIFILVIALVQQHRFYKDKKRCRDSDRYENDLRDIPYMGHATPRAPTETTSLWNEARELPGKNITLNS